MSTELSTAQQTPKGMRWAGYVLSGLIFLLLIFSAVMKLSGAEEIGKEFVRLGYEERIALAIGVTEIVCAVLYILPPTSVLGAVLLTGYLGGATATHVRIGDPFYGPIVIGVLVWVALFLRDARVRALLPLRR